jgi:hypothetical protein
MQEAALVEVEAHLHPLDKFKISLSISTGTEP